LVPIFALIADWAKISTSSFFSFSLASVDLTNVLLDNSQALSG